MQSVSIVVIVTAFHLFHLGGYEFKSSVKQCIEKSNTLNRDETSRVQINSEELTDTRYPLYPHSNENDLPLRFAVKGSICNPHTFKESQKFATAKTL